MTHMSELECSNESKRWDSGNFSVEPDPHQSFNERWADHGFLTDPPAGKSDRQRQNTL